MTTQQVVYLKKGETVLWNSHPDVEWYRLRKNGSPATQQRTPERTWERYLGHSLFWALVKYAVGMALGFMSAAFLASLTESPWIILVVVFGCASGVAGWIVWINMRLEHQMNNPKAAVQTRYLITNRRIVRQYKTRDSYLLDESLALKRIKSVIISRRASSERIEWQPKGRRDSIQIDTHDAMALVRLVEQARGRLLPLTDLRNIQGKKKAR